MKIFRSLQLFSPPNLRGKNGTEWKLLASFFLRHAHIRFLQMEEPDGRIKNRGFGGKSIPNPG